MSHVVKVIRISKELRSMETDKASYVEARSKALKTELDLRRKLDTVDSKEVETEGCAYEEVD